MRVATYRARITSRRSRPGRHRAWRATLGIASLLAAASMSTALAVPAGAATSVTLGYFTGSLPTPATVIATTPSLLKAVPATITWSPVTAGVTALAEMEGGSLLSITGVGNPPVVGAIGTGVDVDVLWAVSLTASTLIVPKSITKPSQLAGKTIGDLEGSSTDYQVRGWLTAEHLTKSVTVDGFPSVAAVASAELSGKLEGAYVNGVQVTQLTRGGGHVLVNSKQIAAVGYGGFNVLAVAHSLIQSNPKLVQDYVCASLTATKDILGPDSEKYFKSSAKLLGIPEKTAVTAGKADISYYITLKQEKSWLQGSNGSTATGQLTNDYLKTAQFDLSSGRITSIPTRAEVASHIDPKFALNALSGHCS